MKRILITGANSYIGISFDNYLKSWPDEYLVSTLDMKNASWKETDFSPFDVVFHVAGIAHSDSGKITAEQEKLYKSVNTDLTIETAKKSKKDGVKQFIFMSSIIVYGESAPIGKEKFITKETEPAPTNCYGKSKLQAEIGIQALNADDFNVVILRPPMIYGKDCKGNYLTLSKLAKKLPVFPDVDSQRSMLYIENLCEFVKLMIDNDTMGIFWPQNAEYSNTSKLVKMIAKAHGKGIRLTKAFNWALYLLRPFTGMVDKAFGNLIYEQSMSVCSQDYNLIRFEESIKRSERRNDENYLDC